MISKTAFTGLSLAGTVLALVVISLGAFVRLSDAGLGCPDWPGCYGHIAVPQGEEAVQQANLAYPDRPLETSKAWIEMVHRYLAGVLGLMILLIAFSAWRRRRMPGQRLALPLALLALVLFQALLGMWTVTLKLSPAVVTAHLLGGATTAALLWWLTLRQGNLFKGHGAAESLPQRRGWVAVGLVVVFLQLFLGAWTSTNYAALACPDFPACHGSWWPSMDIESAFTIWHVADVDYEGGVLSPEARVAVHVTHRLGALVTFLYIGWLALRAFRAAGHTPMVVIGGVTLVVLLTQVGLGIANVLYSLPLALAVAHNAGAALLLLSVVTMYHILSPTPVSI